MWRVWMHELLDISLNAKNANGEERQFICLMVSRDRKTKLLLVLVVLDFIFHPRSNEKRRVQWLTEVQPEPLFYVSATPLNPTHKQHPQTAKLLLLSHWGFIFALKKKIWWNAGKDYCRVCGECVMVRWKSLEYLWKFLLKKLCWTSKEK